MFAVREVLNTPPLPLATQMTRKVAIGAGSRRPVHLHGTRRSSLVNNRWAVAPNLASE
jgi:hypothetical protein